jgi:hypothetical protein
LIELWTEHVDRHITSHRDDLCDRGRQVITQIGLREEDNSRGTALTRHQQVSLQPPEAEVMIQGHDNEDDVHVSGHHLLVGHVARHPP